MDLAVYLHCFTSYIPATRNITDKKRDESQHEATGITFRQVPQTALADFSADILYLCCCILRSECVGTR